MKKSKTYKLFYIYCILIVVLLFTSIHIYLNHNKEDNDIIIFENIPEYLKSEIEKEFNNYNIKTSKDSHLLYFLDGTSKVLIHDIEAYSLIDKNKEYNFYPLYNDIVVIAIDKDFQGNPILGYEDLLDLETEISIPRTEPIFRYILTNISHCLIGRFDNGEGLDYFKSIGEKSDLLWNGEDGQVNINFASNLRDDNYKILVPREGALSYEVGILSHETIDEHIIERLRGKSQRLDFSNNDKIIVTDQEIRPAIELKDEYLELNSHRSAFRRQLLNEKTYAFATGPEHHLASLVIIGLIILWIMQVERRVIHKGIKKGLMLIGIMSIGLITLGVFKYALYRYNMLAHMSWYLYYVFLLPMPVFSLYIAEHADKLDNERISIWIKISTIILVIFLILVLTNDYHQLVFKFSTEVFEEIEDEYSYGLVFVLFSIWYGISQGFAFIWMLKKGFDSPDKKKVTFPFIIFIIYLMYIIAYNTRIKVVHDFPLVLGTSILQILYWSSAILSGLIPSNRDYYNLFKSSKLKMQIIDQEGNTRYSAIESDNVSDEVINYLKSHDIGLQSQILEGDNLMWLSSISGGKVVTQENIREISELRKSLEETTSTLEKENLILHKKEKIEKRLILLNEQNNLTKEVHRGIKDKLGQMEKLITEIENSPNNKKIKLIRMHIFAIYCKRKSELLIKSKKNKELPAQEICRIIQEVAAMLPKDCFTFCQIDGNISYVKAIEIYEYYHNILDILYQYNIKEVTIRIYKKNDSIIINTLVNKDIKQYYKEIEERFIGKKDLTFIIKEFEDSTSIIILKILFPYL